MPDLLSIAEELYGLLPSEFTDARNERAKQLRGEDRTLADEVGGLPKPATAAWALNALVRHQGDLVGQVVDLGESLREAQQQLAGDELRELSRQRRRLTAAVTAQARELAGRLGVKVSATLADQVEESLRAAMTDPGAAAALRTGLLVKPLTSTGLGDLDPSSLVAVPEAVGAAGPPGRAGLSVVGGKSKRAAGKARGKDEAAARRRELREAESAQTQAEATAERAQRELDEAAGRVGELEARSLQLQSELEEVRRRVDELEHALESVDDELSDAEDERDRVEQDHSEAVAELDRARSVVRRLRGE